MLAIVGIAIKASMRDALKRFNPVLMSNMLCRKGAMTTMPKNPMMTDGIDAMSSIVGLMISRTAGGASSERYIAMARLNGTAIAEATSVTVSDAMRSGNVPNFAGVDVGYHSVPKKNSLIGTVLNIGMPSLKRKSMMSTRNTTEEKPTAEKMYFDTLSAMV
jgi:hypothetical protein